MIAITGASGNLGQATLNFLLQKTEPQNIIAVVRNATRLGALANTGIQVRTADYADPASLAKAFAGVDTLLQVSSSAMGSEATLQEYNVVKAAVGSSVKKIVYTSTLHPVPDAHFIAAHTCGHTETAIRNSGMQYVIFRNSMYQETVPLFIGNALEDGQIYYPSAKGKVSFVSRIDIAEALSNVLRAPGTENKVYKITGSESFTFPDISGLLHSAMGLSSGFHLLSFGDYQAGLEALGMDTDEAGFYVSMARSIDSNEFSATDTALKTLLGREPQSLSTYMQQLAATV